VNGGWGMGDSVDIDGNEMDEMRNTGSTETGETRYRKNEMETKSVCGRGYISIGTVGGKPR